MIESTPHNFDIEQSLLGAIMVDNGAYHAVSEIVTGVHFADPLHGRIFDSLRELIDGGKRVNAVTLKTWLDRDGDVVDAGGSKYLARLVSSSVHAIDAAQIARQVRDLYQRRKIIELAQAAIDRAQSSAVADDAQQQIEALEHGLIELGRGAADDGFKDAESVIGDAVRMAEAAYSRGTEVSGLSTGFMNLNAALGGLHPGELIILAGRPAMGKTALATNIALNAATSIPPLADQPPPVVGFFSLEMSSTSVMTRVLSEQAGVSSHRVRRGEINSTEFDRFLTAGFDLNARLFLDDTALLTIAALRARSRRLKRQHGLDLVVVDYLQLLQGTSPRANRLEDIGEISRGLKALAKELAVPVLALSQLSRAVESRDDKRPQLSDLRESGSIEQDADVVMFVYRDEYYLARQEPTHRPGEDAQKFNDRHDAWCKAMDQSRGRAEVIIGKHRHGPTSTVRFNFDAALTRFTDPAEDDEASSW